MDKFFIRHFLSILYGFGLCFSTCLGSSKIMMFAHNTGDRGPSYVLNKQVKDTAAAEEHAKDTFKAKKEVDTILEAAKEALQAQPFSIGKNAKDTLNNIKSILSCDQFQMLESLINRKNAAKYFMSRIENITARQSA